MDTLVWSDAAAEIHQVVVGPVDNNVYVLRCRESGDAVLLDAANEHDRLLELCQALGVRQVLEKRVAGCADAAFSDEVRRKVK